MADAWGHTDARSGSVRGFDPLFGALACTEGEARGNTADAPEWDYSTSERGLEEPAGEAGPKGRATA